MSYVEPKEKARQLVAKLGKKGARVVAREVIAAKPGNYMTTLFGGYRYEVIALPYWEAVMKGIKNIKTKI